MKINYKLPSPGQLRWTFSVILEKTGKWPLLLFLIPLFFLLYWGTILHSENLSLQNETKKMIQQLSISLPLHSEEQDALENSLSVTEYEQVKILFDILHRHSIHIESGSYHVASDNESTEKTLELTLPLQGEWLTLANAMDDINRAIPVDIKSLIVSRHSPETKQLSITIRLTLHRGEQ